MVHDAASDVEMNWLDSSQEFAKGAVLLVTPARCDLKSIMFAQQVLFNAVCETPVSVSTHASGLIEFVFEENVANIHACMTAEGIMDV